MSTSANLAAPSVLQLPVRRPVRAQNAGLFVSHGVGLHPDRVIDSFELILVRSGAVAVEEEGREFEVSEGETLLFWPARRHRGTAAYAPELRFYWVHFTLERSAIEEDFLSIAQHARPRRPEVIADLFHRFMADQEAGDLNPVSANYLLMLMLVEAATERGPAGGGADALLAARAEAFIAANFHRNLGTAEVARQLGFNPDYLERVFRRERGATITEHIHRSRIREARTLLRDSVLNVSQVAAACGFSDDVYFRRLFKRHTGLTPVQFRRLHVRTHINVS